MEDAKVVSKQDLTSWERFYRANFMNSLCGFRPTGLIGSIDENQQTNLAIFSNIVHLGADPALIGFINRPLEAAPHTIGNIQKTGTYTINHVHENILKQAHQTSAKYAKATSEFDATGLTAEFFDGFEAPFVKESRIKIGLKLEEIIPISINRTYLVIGSVQIISVPQNIISEDGFLQIEKAGSVCSNGIDGYYKSSLIDRYRYAKPDSTTESITKT